MEAHQVLGIPKDASEEQVRAAYKALALKWHPDRQLQNREQATSKFVEINRANRTMLRTLTRARRAGKSTRACPTSDPPPPSPAASASHCASSKQPTRSTRSRRSPSQSPTSSRPPSSSPTHSSQPSRTPSSSQSHEDTPCTSSSSVTSSVPSDPAMNAKGPVLEKHHHYQPNTCDSNPKTFLRQSYDSLTFDPDFVGDTLRPERSILRGAGADAPKKWVHILNMTLDEIYQGKTFHFRLIRYTLSGKKSAVPLDVTVPLGSRDGTEVIITNVGNERKDGTRQDIVFLVKVLRHKCFSRVHDDLLLEVRLPWVDSLNEKEGEVRLNGIDGKEYAFYVDFCKTGLLSGTTIIPNAGMPCRVGFGRGRIIIRWEISSPLSSWDTIKHVLKFKS
ncbi:DnaJ-domain-containing protein [Phlegmacium glaucopus]|nr:DnaJ-domain-containing protein [Phlegmacium glaucopus]